MPSALVVMMGSVLSGCSGRGHTLGVLAMVVVVYLVQSVFFAQQKCPYCGEKGVTGGAKWTCNHCGRSF
jgi:hypothetical protein